MVSIKTGIELQKYNSLEQFEQFKQL